MAFNFCATTLPQHHSEGLRGLMRWPTFRFSSGTVTIGGARLERETSWLLGVGICCGLLPPVAQTVPER
jgi:hypothetical protein